MNQVTLPPSPNWYLSNILSCAKDGTVAWGSRNCIVVGKPGDKSIEYSLICDAHPGRVTCLSFSPEYGDERGRLVVSGGDEHVIRIWNVDTRSAVSSTSYTDTNQRVVGVDWSRCNSDLIRFISGDGLLVSWNVTYNANQQYSLPKMNATCLASSPHRSDIVAIGAKNGLIYIANLGGNGTIAYKLRGHDVEITSLSWCPSVCNILDDSASKDSLLASGAKDRSVFVWRAGGDGRCQMEISLPTAPLDTQQHRVKLNSTVGNWTSVCWASPKRLFASSSWGELIAWDFGTPGGRKKPVCKLVHALHGRGLFCIVAEADAGVSTDEQENWRDSPKPIKVWTVAQDRRVIRSSVTSTECAIEYSVPTQGGYVYCVAACPLDTSRIAFGVGDAMLRLWNLSEPHEMSFDIVTLWQKIMGKVRAIAWHPEKENLLAFGTGEGRVGVWDVNTSKPPILHRQYHRHTVYSLGWAPHPDNKNFVLYSCGDGELVYYESEKGSATAPTAANTATKGVKSVFKKDCTEFAWKPDNTCLAVGFENGSISFLNRRLVELGEPIHSLKKAVQCLAWHPESTATDLRLSPLRNYLAVATNSPTITVYDLSELLESIEEDVATVAEETTSSKVVARPKLAATLSGHADRVVALVWSSHMSGRLVSGSYDHTAQVWNLETQQPIATYTGHAGPIQSCLWSPLDPDYIITGSSDFTIRVWKISDQSVVQHPTSERCQSKRIRTKKSKKTRQIETNDVEKKVVKEATAKQAEDKDQGASDSSKVDSLSEQKDACAIHDGAAKNTSVSKTRKTKKGAYLAAYSKRLSDKSVCLNTIRALVKKQINSQANSTNGDPAGESAEGGDGENDPHHFSTIFGDLDDISVILEQEHASHANQQQYNLMTEMSLWNNDLRKNLQVAVKEKRLNDFMVSLATSLSMKTWQEMCEAYATQLVFESNPSKAVSYFLCIHKIHRAVQVFLDQRMYKEAYILAKCKLDSDDPIFTKILNDWANSAMREGNFEDVTQCYIKLGDFGKAAKYLGRRQDVASLEVAAELALLSKEPGLVESLADQALDEALLNADCETARRLLDKFPQIQHRRAQIVVFDEVKRAIEAITAKPVTCQEWLERGSSDHGLLDKLCELCKEYSTDYDRFLKDARVQEAVPENERTLWVTTSRYLALAAIADLPEQRISHVVSTLSAISQFEFIHSERKSEQQQHTESLLIRILSVLESVGPTNEGSAFAVNEKQVYTSLRAFLCLGLLNWLVEEETMGTQIDERRRIDDNVLALIGKLLQDALDQRTVKYWTITNRVNKLEASLANKSVKDEADQEEAKSETAPAAAALIEELDQIRSEKKLFVEERVCAPNPILVYSKATELLTFLPDGETKDNFAKILLEAWTKATSQ